MLRLAGAEYGEFTTPEQVAWDTRLDLDQQIKALEKWLLIQTSRYHEDRTQENLNKIREIHNVLTGLRSAKGVALSASGTAAIKKSG